MTALIRVLNEEHRNIEKLLKILDSELAVFDRGEQPDYEILQAIAGYFMEYANRCHHPKEDVIFSLLRQRDASMEDAIAEIEAEHKSEAERLGKFAQVIESVRLDHEIRRQTLHDAVSGFIKYQRAHIDKEEGKLFPAALKALTSEDWAQIASQDDSVKDPLFDGEVEEKFRALHQRFLQWGAENEAERAGASGV
ncbi:MAG: hemerythrin domain-containing protein [Alphaproteobacteria bacterium]